MTIVGIDSMSFTATADRVPQIAPTTWVRPQGTYKADVWITDGAWISGLAGALTCLLCGYWLNRVDAFSQGLAIFGWKLAQGHDDSVLVALVLIAAAMILVEFIRLLQVQRGNFIQRSPLLTQNSSSQNRTAEFVRECVFLYLQNLLLFWVVKTLYQSSSQYPVWNQTVEFLWRLYLWSGLPYALVTRAYKYDPNADLVDYPALLTKLFRHAAVELGLAKWTLVPFDSNDKKTLLGFVIKIFFAPMMTVFFFNQFPSMVRNFGYLIDHLPGKLASGNYTHEEFNKDFYNIAKTFFLSIDVALAWCGYVFTSRWLDNRTQSAEPTLLGWSVCLLSYPPFQLLGLYFAYPAESAIFQYDSPWVISLFVVLAILSYFIYMCATLYFGVRFSNLTHRGVIRKGPFAIIRHPAYASKNLSWWLVILPAIIMNIQNTGYLMALVLAIGLAVQTWVYYMRAITEERHLSADPVYLEYCQQVKYRFIPGVI
jgi:protein-S-isoprenylcysteine O-methyltransferase Ste14